MIQSNKYRIVVISTFVTLLAGCASLSEGKKETRTLDDPTYQAPTSFLKGEESLVDESDQGELGVPAKAGKRFQKLGSLNRGDVDFTRSTVETNFSNDDQIKVSAEDMPAKDFIHYVYGELLNINYVLSPGLGKKPAAVTLNLKRPISSRKLFNLVQEILAKRNVETRFKDDVYYVLPLAKDGKSSKAVGVGRSVDDVPNAAGDIMQVVPMLYGIKGSIHRTIQDLVNVQAKLEVSQSAVVLTGKRDQIIRAVELINLLDAPSNRGKYVGLITLTYTNMELFLGQLQQLLAAEGVATAVGQVANENVALVPIPQVGRVAVFAASNELLRRVTHWSNVLDQPAEGTSRQYFIYHPKYARASDIGTSLSPLLSAKTKASEQVSMPALKQSNVDAGPGTGKTTTTNRSVGGGNDELSFVVDERANALIFYTTGTEYRSIVPLVQKLDVLPRQVMLDIMIAEVTLTGTFKYGVEFAFQSGDLSIGTSGALGVSEIGGLGINISGVDGDFVAQFFETNQFVNVLSNPSLLVRDGVEASIMVGTELAIVGSTTSDPINGDRETTQVEYRQTGVEVTVTPTINAQGVVIMDISESISNEVTGSAGVTDNPNIFNRQLSTEVVAESGQTVILGGLISDNKTVAESQTPWVADIPLLGNLFRSEIQESDRTELILMVTPKVIHRFDQWGDIKDSFQQNLERLMLPGQEAETQPQN